MDTLKLNVQLTVNETRCPDGHLIIFFIVHLVLRSPFGAPGFIDGLLYIKFQGVHPGHLVLLTVYCTLSFEVSILNRQLKQVSQMDTLKHYNKPSMKPGSPDGHIKTLQ
jgi:hypothetical protein